MFRPNGLSTPGTRIIIVISVMAIILGITALVIKQQASSSQPHNLPPTVTPGPITIEGAIVCLPHKNTEGPQTLECAFGLQANSGEYYGLKGLDQEKLMNGSISVSTKVIINGEVVAPGQEERYGVVGNITVKSIEVISSSVLNQNTLRSHKTLQIKII